MVWRNDDRNVSGVSLEGKLEVYLASFPVKMLRYVMSKSSTPPVSVLAEEFHLVIAQLVRRLRAEGSQHELSWSQLSAMGRLEIGGPATIAMLARIEAVKPQSMGATIAALERAGFVARNPHPSDGRQIVFSLTPSGRKVRVDGAKAKRKWLAGKIAEELRPVDQRKLSEAVGLMHKILRGHAD
ncbi:MAG TPA: MarR family transcriptional regulator [Lacunisphaera sp.]|jgi:DNA-binding MarR family transcriptional regulator